MHLVDDHKNAEILIHNGKFHVDEMLAVYIYEKAVDRDVAVIRANQVPDDYKGICMDIGDRSGRDDIPIFDHHKAKQKEEEKGMAACGKVFEHYKKQALPKMFNCQDIKLAAKVFREDVLNPIQAQDVFGTPGTEGITYLNRHNMPTESTTRPISFSSAIQKLNPTYLNEDKADEYFAEAYKCVKNTMDMYCDTLSERINRGIIKDTRFSSNFLPEKFACEQKFFNKERYPEFGQNLFYNMLMSRRGDKAFYMGNRQFLVSDIFMLNNPEKAGKIFDKISEGYKSFEKDFGIADQIMSQKINEAEKSGKAVIVLDKFVPWKSFVLHANRDKDKTVSIDFVVTPAARAKGEWNIHAVCDRSDNGTHRVPMPKGLQSATEEQLNNFCPGLKYVSSFMAATDSKELAVKFAEELVDRHRTLKLPKDMETTADLKLDMDTKRGMRHIDFNDKLTKIADKSFWFSHNLEELKIPANVSIGTSAFYSCKNLKSLEIEPGTKSIGYFAFANCNKLENVTLPDTINRLNPSVFENTPVKNVTIQMTSFKNILNTVRLGEQFPNANVTVDCASLVHEKFAFQDFTSMLDEINNKINEKEQNTDEKLSFEEQVKETEEIKNAPSDISAPEKSDFDEPGL